MALILSGDTGPSFVQAAAQPAGSIIQTIQSSLGGTLSTGSSSFVAMGLNATITPQFSNSKILVLVSIGDVYTSNPGLVTCITTYRNGTNLSSGSGYSQAFAYIWGGNSAIQVNANYSFIDSPATTSATTYAMYWNSQSGTTYANINGQTSYIQLMEIKV